VTAAPAPFENVVAPSPATWAAGGRRWVHDPDDDQACLRRLTALNDLAAGRVVCHPTPGASWPVLIRDLLEALGKRRDALTHERRVRDGADLLQVWMRAERVRHLVVLRAHRLPPRHLAAVASLAAATRTTLWLVWHDIEPPAAGWEGEVWSWVRAVAAIGDHTAPNGSLRLRSAERIYREAVAEARREARLWRIAPPRQRRYTQPRCGLGALVQRLTINAATEAELRVRLDAARAGFAAEGLTLVLPADPSSVAMLGPRITPQALSKLRRISCPTSAAALLLAVATDARPGRIAGCAVRSVSPDAGQVQLLPGTYRIPVSAAPLMRAALIEHHERGLPGYALLTGRDGGLLLAQAMVNRIARTATFAGISRAVGRSDSGPEEPFAAPLVNSGAVRIDGAEPPSWPRSHLPSPRP
jgi:hypothetical protein